MKENIQIRAATEEKVQNQMSQQLIDPSLVAVTQQFYSLRLEKFVDS